MTAITSLGPLGLPFGARTFADKQAAIAKKAGALGRKKQKRQWYTLPNGIRVLATSEAYARMAAQYEIERKREPVEPIEVAAEPVFIAEPAENAEEAAPGAVEAGPVPDDTGPLLGVAPASSLVAEQPLPIDAGLLASVAAAESLERARARLQLEAEQKAAIEAERLRQIRLREEEVIIMRLILEAA